MAASSTASTASWRHCRCSPSARSGWASDVRRVAVLGATASIGSSALDVIARQPDTLRATVLAAGSNVEALVALCRRHRPDHAVVAERGQLGALQSGLRAAGLATRAHAGSDAVE